MSEIEAEAEDEKQEPPRSVWIFIIGIALLLAAFYFGTRRDPRAELARMDWPEPQEDGKVVEWRAIVSPTRMVSYVVTRDASAGTFSARYESTEPEIAVNVPELDPTVIEELRKALTDLDACGLPPDEQVSEGIRPTLSLRLPGLSCDLARTPPGWDEAPFNRIRHLVAAVHGRGFY